MKKPRTYQHLKRGYREDLGMSFRSKAEANFARYLNFLKKHKHIEDWSYESIRFYYPIKGTNNSYLPDFVTLELKTDVGMLERLRFYEVKGYMSPRDKTKIKRMKLYYPQVRLEIIDSTALKKIIKSTEGLVKYER